MEFPNENPRLPKLPFIVGDLILLALALFFVLTADSPPSTGSIIAIVVCTGLGVTLWVAPFVREYARAEDQRLDERQRALETLSRSASEATDQASIAARGIAEVVESFRSQTALLASLPAEIQTAREAALTREEKASEARIDKLSKDLHAVEKSVAEMQDAITAQLGALDTKLAELTVLAATPPAPVATEPVETPEPKKKSRKPRKKTPKTSPQDDEPLLLAEENPAEASSAAPEETEAVLPLDEEKETPPESVVSDEIVEPASQPLEVEEAAPPESIGTEISPEEKPVEDPAPDSPEPSESAVTDDVLEPEEPNETDATDEHVADIRSERNSPLLDDDSPSEQADSESDNPPREDDPSPEEPEADAEPTASGRTEDGTTRLTVTAYIGIGNRLFIRGNGAGLSPDEGTPLQFVSIGKWRWESPDATEPITATLWKNDEELCSAVGEITLHPGQDLETAANF
ncbi:MAG: hypothetical protein SynsKO_21040 [Synoicihabitans sp.]